MRRLLLLAALAPALAVGLATPASAGCFPTDRWIQCDRPMVFGCWDYDTPFGRPCL